MRNAPLWQYFGYAQGDTLLFHRWRRWHRLCWSAAKARAIFWLCAGRRPARPQITQMTQIFWSAVKSI